VARERTKHSNCSVGLGGGGALEFVWCKQLGDVVAAAQEMLDWLDDMRSRGGGLRVL
jgi:hypothetical protein